MSHIERDFMRQVDELVLSATPELQAKLAQIDTQAQLTGKTFYDVYSALSDEDKRQIIILAKK
jgi:aminoglycoside/choline kinase family phosphotransferase